MRSILLASLFTSIVLAQQTVTVSSSGNSAQATVSPAAPVTLSLATPTAIITAQLSAIPIQISMPIEVVGPAGATQTAQFVIPQGTNLSQPFTLWLQVHNVDYDAEASVQVNNSVWLPISNSTVSVQGPAANFGGLGGAWNTVPLTITLPANVVTAGANTITFRFNGSDGIRSGYRVLGFNIQAAGANLIPASVFTQVDPFTWTPPLNNPADIAAGKTIWQTAALSDPASGASIPIKAHCSDCHTYDGQDLKYFNYSNASIVARAQFHGLSLQQGQQIASYIRSLAGPAPGRPWNPPYQPGPGIDAGPGSSWAAGAGIAAVLPSDASLQPILMPNGVATNFGASEHLNLRQTPLPFPLPDWNRWLPTIYPSDGSFASTWATATEQSNYANVKAIFANATTPLATTYKNQYLGPISSWTLSMSTIVNQLNTSPLYQPGATWTATDRQSRFSIAQLAMVKLFEFFHETGVELIPSAIYGAKANQWGWSNGVALTTSPNNTADVPFGPGIGNGTKAGADHVGLSWYLLQGVLNDGQGNASGNNPIDWGYMQGAIMTAFRRDANQPYAWLGLAYMIKNLQADSLNGVGVSKSTAFNGADPRESNPGNLLYINNPMFAAYPSAALPAISAYTQAWISYFGQFTQAQYVAGGSVAAGEAPPNEVSSPTSSFGHVFWFALPRLRALGVDAATMAKLYALAQAVFPTANWAQNQQATCDAPSIGNVSPAWKCTVNSINVF